MNDTTKPLADIIAEARNKYTVHNCNECDYRKSCDLRFDCDECKTTRKSISLAFGIEDDYFAKLLDQIEKAVDRERKERAATQTPGNAAALRKALENVERVARFCAEMPRYTPGYPTDAARADVLYSRIAELGRVARAALSVRPETPSNAAAMREALVEISQMCGVGPNEVSAIQIAYICDKALRTKGE